MLSRNTDSTCKPTYGTYELFSVPAHKVGLLTRLDSLRFDYSWRWDVERIYFYQVLLDWFFFITQVSEESDSSHRMMIGIPNRSKVMPSQGWDKKTRQNSLYKGGRTKIGSVPVVRDEWKYPKPKVACEWPLHFSTPIDLGRP